MKESKRKEDVYVTNAPKEEEVTVELAGSAPNVKSEPGNSVDEHQNLEIANEYFAAGELKQQNENL